MTRVLVVDLEPPQPTRDGGSARMVEILALLRELGHEVAFASVRGGDLDDHADRYDVVVLSHLAVAADLLDRVRAVAPQARVVYDAVHVEHLAQYRLARLTRNRPLLAAALETKEREVDVLRGVDAVVVTSREDADTVVGLVPDAEVHVVPGVHPEPVAPTDHERAGMVYLGYLPLAENQHAVRRLLDEVWPRVRKERGPTPLTVLGAAPPAWLSARDDGGLRVSGHLPDLGPPLLQAAVMVCPLEGGSGVKTKVLQAVARRVPVVSTADGVRGLGLRHGVHALVAENDDELAAHAVRVLDDPAYGARLAAAAADLVTTDFSRDVGRARLAEVVRGRA